MGRSTQNGLDGSDILDSTSLKDDLHVGQFTYCELGCVSYSCSFTVAQIKKLNNSNFRGPIGQHMLASPMESVQ